MLLFYSCKTEPNYVYVQSTAYFTVEKLLTQLNRGYVSGWFIVPASCMRRLFPERDFRVGEIINIKQR